MVLIPKGGGDYGGIGLVKVMWKVVLNLRLSASTNFHNLFHGFLEGHRTGTATLEAKLCQQLAVLKEEVLYAIFLDMHKYYDALNMSR